MKAENYVSDWLDKTYGGGSKELDDWTPSEVMRFADDFAAKSSRLKESNELLRSALLIANREGAETNWTAFKNQVKKELEIQHEIMYGNDENETENSE